MNEKLISFDGKNYTTIELQKKLDKRTLELSKLLNSVYVIDDEINEKLSDLYENILILEFAINYG